MELLGKSRDELKAYCAGAGRADLSVRTRFITGCTWRGSFRLSGGAICRRRCGEKLKREATVTLPSVRRRYVSSDGSVRYLYGLPAQEEKSLKKPAAVEAVFMPSEARQTICISTQAGCAVDCQFCLTAQLGLIRNLTAGEILAQVLLPLKERWRARESGGHDRCATRSARLPLLRQGKQ